MNCRTEQCCPPALDYRADSDPIPPIGGNPPGCPVATVTINPPDGSFVLTPTLVVLTTDIAGAVIYYTLDGSEPTAASTVYSAPFSLTSLAQTVQARAIITGCDPGAVSSASYQQVTDGSFVFGYLCASGDHVGAFGEFAANGQANDYQFVLLMTLNNNTEILDITILQTESDGVWDSGQSWATKEFIFPLGVSFHTYPLVLIDQAGPTQLFTAYETTLGTIAAGTYEWRMWGQPFAPLNGYFELLVTLANGTVIRRIIDTICTDPPPPCEPPVFVSLTVNPAGICPGDTVEVSWILSGSAPSAMTVDGASVTPALSGSSFVVVASVPYSIVVTAHNTCGNASDSVVVIRDCVECFPDLTIPRQQTALHPTLKASLVQSGVESYNGLTFAVDYSWDGIHPTQFIIGPFICPSPHNWQLRVDDSITGALYFEGYLDGDSPIGTYTRTAGFSDTIGVVALP